MLMPSIMGVRGVPLVHTRPDIGVLNGEFTAWTGDDPDNWTVASEDAANYITEHVDGAHIVSDDSSPVNMVQTVAVTSGVTYTIEMRKSSHVFGFIRLSVKANSTANIIAAANVASSDANGTFTVDVTAIDGGLIVKIWRDTTAGNDYVLERVTIRRAA